MSIKKKYSLMHMKNLENSLWLLFKFTLFSHYKIIIFRKRENVFYVYTD